MSLLSHTCYMQTMPRSFVELIIKKLITFWRLLKNSMIGRGKMWTRINQSSILAKVSGGLKASICVIMRMPECTINICTWEILFVIFLQRSWLLQILWKRWSHSCLDWWRSRHLSQARRMTLIKSKMSIFSMKSQQTKRDDWSIKMIGEIFFFFYKEPKISEMEGAIILEKSHTLS